MNIINRVGYNRKNLMFYHWKIGQIVNPKGKDMKRYVIPSDSDCVTIEILDIGVLLINHDYYDHSNYNTN